MMKKNDDSLLDQQEDTLKTSLIDKINIIDLQMNDISLSDNKHDITTMQNATLNTSNQVIETLLAQNEAQPKQMNGKKEEITQTNQQLDVKSSNTLLQQEEEQKNTQKEIIVLVPLTIPGSGKSMFVSLLQKNFQKDQLFVVSSDQVRRGLMNQYISKFKETSLNQAYEKTVKSYKKAYEKELLMTFTQAKTSKAQRVIVFIDKNHPTNAIPQTILIIKQSLKDAKIIALAPKCVSPYKDYPFSLYYLCSCASRVLQRMNHETLQGTPEKVVSVVVFFFKLFRRTEFQEYFQDIIYFPFTVENPIDTLTYNKLNDSITQLLKFRDLEEMQRSAAMFEFIDLLATVNWGYPSQVDQLKCFPFLE